MPTLPNHRLPRTMAIVALVAAILLSGGTSLAQPVVGPPAGAGGPTGGTDNAGATIAGPKPPGTTIARCTEPTPAPTQTRPPISITVNPSSRWQPRGGEVIVAIEGDASLFKSLAIRACFGWSTADANTFFTADNLNATFHNTAFVQIRPTDRTNLVNIGVVVPQLKPAPSGLFDRWNTAQRAVGFGVIPVADMRLIAYDDAGVLFDVVRPVGITSVWLSLLFTLMIVGLTIGALYRFAMGPVPRPAAGAGPSRLSQVIRMRWVLYLIRGDDGRASLSSFQVLLWTVLVAASAIYVMALSGELINITPGTLTLLGIAGSASVIAMTQSTPLVGPPAQPDWMDLVRAMNGDRADVARMQMLFFTLVSGAFVALQVVTSYVIPDIPSGYQILMGISNGVYVGGKLASKDKTAA